ncbi:unnamed protein product [Pleuronectes platessa]|uniref:Uncharacterized protein n=1 Tax=Pleuronectes platessa TaxID=8262 RepID=A0A9N7VRC4_PLEPL|nr:unnamed protein product [Pleuronectes platessa]
MVWPRSNPSMITKRTIAIDALLKCGDSGYDSASDKQRRNSAVLMEGRPQSYFLPTLLPHVWGSAVEIHMEAGGRGAMSGREGVPSGRRVMDLGVDETSESPPPARAGPPAPQPPPPDPHPVRDRSDG